MFLDHNYEYLELAIYKGHYYVSFPPFPSVFLLPFVIIFKDSIPTNLISFMLFVGCFVVIYRILRKYNWKEFDAILLGLAFTMGTNLIFLSLDSGVWFFAQVLNYFLCLLAINAFLNKKKCLVYLFLALAVGCRPFSIIYIIMFFLYYMVSEKNDSLLVKIKKNIIPLIPAVIIGIIYMWYNYIRFDNILEFGHNYIPEFVNADYGQFSFHYLLPNLKELIFNKFYLNNKLNISFDMPFCFFIANPIFLIYIYNTIKIFIKEKKIVLLRFLILLSIIFNIIFICMHRTLGAWQFGARYTVDVLPFVFLGILCLKNKNCDDYKMNINTIEICLIIFGIILNIYGCIKIFL